MLKSRVPLVPSNWAIPRCGNSARLTVIKPNYSILSPLSILSEHGFVSFAHLRAPFATIAPYSPGINVFSDISTDDRKISVHPEHDGVSKNATFVNVFSFCCLRSNI